MLKKFLPKLNLHLPNKLQSQKLEQNEPQSPNLILFSQADETVQKILPKVVVFTTYLSIIVLLVCLFLFIWDKSLNYKLSSLEVERDSYMQEVANLKQTEADLTEILQLSQKHKEINFSRTKLSDKVTTIFNSLPATMSIESLDFNERNFILTCTSAAPLDIALFITKVLVDTNFESIAIQSVTLNVNNSSYTSVLEVNLRQ